MQRMETETLQRNRDADTNRKLSDIRIILEEVLKELRSSHHHKFSAKVMRSIDQNLRDLRSGKGIRYKNAAEFDKALS